MSYLPSLDEVSKYSVLVTIGTSVGFFVKRFWTVEERERRKIIREHVKHNHLLPFKHCSENKCATAGLQTDYLPSVTAELPDLQ